MACAQERCTSELLIQWYARGDQAYTIRRDCDPEPSPAECDVGESENIKVNFYLNIKLLKTLKLRLFVNVESLEFVNKF